MYMLSSLRRYHRAALAILGLAALLLDGCSSSASSSTAPPKGAIDFWNTGVTVVNDSAQCAWVTPYWSNAVTTWHIFDGGPMAHPHVVEAGKSYTFGYLLIAHSFIVPTLHIKVLAEMQRSPGCGGNTGQSPANENTDLHPIGSDANVCAHIKASNGGFSVTEPKLVHDPVDC
ncbi:MAG TPA: hypothetical protein VGG89_06560 [Candidatus Baltobacteraceae bacterium]|jgi:hypothetical protein